MTTQLDSLRSMTVVVADTGDIDAIKKYNLKMLTKFSSMTLGLRMVVKILYEQATV